MMLGLINRNFNHMSIPSFVALYKSMVRSHLDYCCPVWIDTCIERPRLQRSLESV